MRKTIIAMLAAAAVLVVGGAVGAIAQTDETTPEGDTAVIEAAPQGHRGERLSGLLDEMVEDGVITAEQAGSITEWLENKRTEVQAEREALRAAFDEAWSDGVLTEEEAAQFPFFERLGAVEDLWADGQVTQEEWDAFRDEFGRRGLRHRLGG